MLKVAVLPNMVLASELCARLSEAAIPAEASFDSAVPSVLGGGTTSSVWVTDDSDVEWARAIVAAFTEEVAARADVPHCPDCGYDLRGHSGKGHCPECARPFHRSGGDAPCPECNAMVPANFTACWNCGADLLPEGASDDP